MLTTNPAFKPPFCPRPSCFFHRHPEGWEYVRDGTHLNRVLQRRIRRFRCLECGRCFSTQTFDTTYWLKKPDIQRDILKLTQACAGFRQIAEVLGVAHSTVAGQVARLGRHCLLVHEMRRPRSPPDEDLVLDGFVTFEYSQYWPCHFNTLVGADSYFIHGFTDSEVRRSGSMTPAQKERRRELEAIHGRPRSDAVVNGVEQVLRMLAPEPAQLVIRSDEHRDYPRAFKRLAHLDITHRCTSSKAPRTSWNPLFPVNLLHLQVRHRGSNHKRETIAFSKRRQSAAERLGILQVGRNYMRARSVRDPKGASPAEHLGLMKRKLSLSALLRRRLFPSLLALPERIRQYYERAVETRQIPNGRRHDLVYAF